MRLACLSHVYSTTLGCRWEVMGRDLRCMEGSAGGCNAQWWKEDTGRYIWCWHEDGRMVVIEAQGAGRT